MRIIKRPESEEVVTLRKLVEYRHHGTCPECKTSYEADWQDLEAFMDPESYVHIHCPTCGHPSVIAAFPEDLLMFLRSIAGRDELDNDDEE
jgi:hypothetical protein